MSERPRVPLVEHGSREGTRSKKKKFLIGKGVMKCRNIFVGRVVVGRRVKMLARAARNFVIGG